MQTRSDMRQALIQRMVKFTVRLDSMLRALPPSGRGRRPRRPASPLASPWTSPLARRAEDVAPYHGVRAGVWRGRGRRPRRPAFPWASPWARRAGDVAPDHVVRAKVWRGRGRCPGGPRSRGRPRGRPRWRGAPGTSRPTMGCARACRGRGRRPRRPASPWARRAGDVAPDHVVRAGVWRGRGRRPRRPASPWASPWSSPWARRAGDVAPYHGVRAGVWRGRGRRPRRPAYTWASPWARRAGDVACPTMRCARACGVVGADVPGGPRPRGHPRGRPRGRGAPWTSYLAIDINCDFRYSSHKLCTC